MKKLLTSFFVIMLGVVLYSCGDSSTTTTTTITPPGGGLTNTSIVGTWGVISIHHANNDTWSSELTRITYNSNGSCSGNGWWNMNASPSSGNYTCNYTAITNPDGSLTLTLTNLPGNPNPVVMKSVISDNGKVAIMNGTGSTNEQFLMMVVRIDTAKTYTNADFSGQYYTMAYEHDALGASSGYYKTYSDITTSNGSGSIISNGVLHGDANPLVPYEINDTYIVNSTGGVFFSGSSVPMGHLSGNGKVLLYSNAGSGTNDWMNGVALKKGDMTYSTASLQGKWALASFGDSNATPRKFVSNYGTMICNSTGQCSLKLKRNENGVITTDSGSIQANIVVAADGSFGGSMAKPGDPPNPAYSSAIGDGGNLIILNLELNGDSRAVMAGVKCSSCGDLTIAASPAFVPK